MSDNECVKTRTKSVLVKSNITVLGNKSGQHVPITLSINAIELNYGPVIDITIRADVPYHETGFVDWSDHPFMWAKHVEKGAYISNIVDDTTAVRALIDELVAPEKELYTTTNCTHKGRLIRAICNFWS